MPDALHGLRRANQPAGTAAHGIFLAGARVDFAHRMAAADRAFVGKLVRLRASRTFLQVHAQHLRDHIAGALDGDGVANADIGAVAQRLALRADALNEVLVVQGRVLHHHAADGDWLELRNRGERTGAADLDVDILDNRGRLLGRKLVRDREARRARNKAEPLLPVEAVELVDHAVDIVAELGALLLDRIISREHLRDGFAGLEQRIDRKPDLAEPCHHARLRCLRHLAHFAPTIGEEFQSARSGDRGIFLAQRAGG